MSERAPTVDDAGLFLPSDMFPDVLNHCSLSSAAASVPRRLPPDDLAYLRPAALSPDLELSRHLAAALTLRRREPHSFFEFGPDVRSPTPAPAPAAPFSSRTAGEVYCRGCLGNLERAERHVDVDPWYRLRLPARPLCVQVRLEEFRTSTLFSRSLSFVSTTDLFWSGGGGRFSGEGEGEGEGSSSAGDDGPGRVERI